MYTKLQKRQAMGACLLAQSSPLQHVCKQYPRTLQILEFLPSPLCSEGDCVVLMLVLGNQGTGGFIN